MNDKAKKCVFTMLAAASMLLPGAPGQAHDEATAKRGCDVSRLHGLYLFKGSGFVLVNGATIPKAAQGTVRFNGDGTVVAETLTLTVLGRPPERHDGGLGVYTVEPNCTGTISFNDGPTWDIFVSSPGYISQIQTGSTGLPPAVMLGENWFLSR